MPGRRNKKHRGELDTIMYMLFLLTKSNLLVTRLGSYMGTDFNRTKHLVVIAFENGLIIRNEFGEYCITDKGRHLLSYLDEYVSKILNNRMEYGYLLG